MKVIPPIGFGIILAFVRLSGTAQLLFRGERR
jgi:hypothetical protein